MSSNNLNVIGKMKQQLIKLLLNDEDVVKILTNQAEVVLPATPLRYHQIFPWDYIPETTQDAKSFITFEIHVKGAPTCAVKNFEVYITVISHGSLMVMDQSVCTALDLPFKDCGSRVDVLADKIDYLVNGSNDFGFGDVELISSPTIKPINGHYGRVLAYRVQGWNRTGEKL